MIAHFLPWAQLQCFADFLAGTVGFFNWSKPTHISGSVFYSVFFPFSARGFCFWYISIWLRRVKFVAMPITEPNRTLLGACSWMLVKTLTMEPAKFIKFVKKLSSPVLLLEKFAHICGILAPRKIACWDAYRASKRTGSIWPANMVGATAQYSNAVIIVLVLIGRE